MKVIQYNAISLNGYIAGPDDDTSFTSKEDWDGFLAMAKKVGNIIIGRRTHDMAKKEGNQLDVRLRIVMTNNSSYNDHTPNTIFTSQSPKEIIELVSSRGFDTTLVAGGGMLNSSFLKAGLIDELYIDVEPIIFGRGIPLFSPDDFEKNLKLLSTTKLNENTVQLHYRVLK